MGKGISLRTYKLIDLAIFTALLIVFEFLGVYVIEKYNHPEFCLSISLPLILICMMRWNGLAFFMPIVSGVVYCYSIKSATLDNYLIYTIGNMFVLINLVWFLKGKEKIRNSLPLSIVYTVTGFLLVALGRTIVATILGNDFLGVLIGFLGAESINLVLAGFIIAIARLQNGLFIDQILYLKNIQKEEEGKE